MGGYGDCGALDELSCHQPQAQDPGSPGSLGCGDCSWASFCGYYLRCTSESVQGACRMEHSKTKDWIRVQCMEPASLTPLCFPKQRKNHHHLPWPDALHRSPSHVCPGCSVPLSLSVSDSPGLPHGWQLKPTRRHILSASMHLSQREGPPPPSPPRPATNWGRAGRTDSGVRALVPVPAPRPPSSGPTSMQLPVHLPEG